MPHPKFDRDKLQVKSLSQRKNKVYIERDHIPIDAKVNQLSDRVYDVIREVVDKIRQARENEKPVILSFGAHTIKNGMAPTLIALMKEGWLTHLATNGAGIIHDWEFAFQGQSSEDVRENVKHGQFGIWQETGTYINLALIVGAYEGLGYGESVGKMISNQGLSIPSVSKLLDQSKDLFKSDPQKAAAAIDLAGIVKKFRLPEGFMSIPHPFKKYSSQSAAYEMNIPFTGHPMIGHDIIYNHPMNLGAAIGRTGLTDFLYFTKNVSNLEKGVYLSIGSAVMSPMIFEKALSMAQNLAIQNKTHIDNHSMYIVDLAPSTWDWENDGEPPVTNPAYYLRYCKSFQRMGGKMKYITADNRDFLLSLYKELNA